MNAATNSPTPSIPKTPWGGLPPQMRVLFITGAERMGGWLADAFACDIASEVLLLEAVGMATGMERLRDELFDAVLVSDEAGLDALAVLDAIRAGSRDDLAIIVLGESHDRDMQSMSYEAGADAFVDVRSTSTRTLIWQTARAMERHALIEENRQLQHEQHHRLQLEHDEASRLIEQQRDMIQRLEVIRDAPPSSLETSDDSPLDLPESLIQSYDELLRTYVIMGSSHLVEELGGLSVSLVRASVTAQEVMQLHVFVLERLIRGLGSRSSRHVMNRADMLILEVMTHFAEGYRQK